MKVSSMAAMMAGAMMGAGAAAAVGMAGARTRRRMKKLACAAGRKMAGGLYGLFG